MWNTKCNHILGVTWHRKEISIGCFHAVEFDDAIISVGGQASMGERQFFMEFHNIKSPNVEPDHCGIDFGSTNCPY